MITGRTYGRMLSGATALVLSTGMAMGQDGADEATCTDLANLPLDGGHVGSARMVEPTQLGLVPCFTPVRSPESDGMAEVFVKILERDHVRITPLPDAATVLGLVSTRTCDDNTVHPRSALAMRPPAELRAALDPSQAVR